jgi:hypothetical protein
LRDDILNRRQAIPECAEPSEDPSMLRDEGPPRLHESPALAFLPDGYEINATGAVGSRFLPFLHRVECLKSDQERAATYTVAAGAPEDLRERTYPDLAALVNEAMTITWEGPLSAVVNESVREAGLMRVLEAGKMTLTDDAGEFCDLGVERYDTVRLIGCQNDFECGIGEICFTHPDAPEGSSGMCLLPGEEVTLADACRGVLVAGRRYLIMDEPTRSLLTLSPRPVVLNATPLGGCTTSEQCEEIHDAERAYVAAAQMTEQPDFSWSCEPHASFGGESRCVMSCADDTSCGVGAVCDGGRCVLGMVPPPECLRAVQRYEVSAGDAFVILGGITGHRHRRIFDGAMCVDDPTLHPLMVGRFRKTAPPCPVDEGLETLTPNPCSFEADEPATLPDSAELASRRTRGIRVRLPGVVLEIADIVTPMPDFPGLFYSPMPFGYQIQLSVGGGFLAREEILEAGAPERIRRDSTGVLWIVDSGDTPATPPLRGQILEFRGGQVAGAIGRSQ